MAQLLLGAAYQPDPSPYTTKCPGLINYRTSDGKNWSTQNFFLSEDHYTWFGFPITEFWRQKGWNGQGYKRAQRARSRKRERFSSVRPFKKARKPQPGTYMSIVSWCRVRAPPRRWKQCGRIHQTLWYTLRCAFMAPSRKRHPGRTKTIFNRTRREFLIGIDFPC